MTQRPVERDAIHALGFGAGAGVVGLDPRCGRPPSTGGERALHSWEHRLLMIARRVIRSEEMRLPALVLQIEPEAQSTPKADENGPLQREPGHRVGQRGFQYWYPASVVAVRTLKRRGVVPVVPAKGGKAPVHPTAAGRTGTPCSSVTPTRRDPSNTGTTGRGTSVLSLRRHVGLRD